MKPNFVFLMGLMIVLMGVLELFMIYVMIVHHYFSMVVFAPLLFLLFVYFILFMGNLWDSDGFRYDLIKVLK